MYRLPNRTQGTDGQEPPARLTNKRKPPTTMPAPRRRHRPDDTRAAMLYLAPNFLGFLIFTLFPVLFSFYMALTNWTLKPAVRFEWLGLRNYADLLGVRALGDGRPDLVFQFFAAAAVLVLATIGVLISQVSSWKGARLGGLFVVGLGVWLLAAALRVGGQGTWIIALLTLLCGVAISLRSKESFRFGVGTLPAIGLLIAALLIGGLNGPMWGAYEPNDARFWQYFYNTAYLMVGIPFGIGGSLALAILLNTDFKIAQNKKLIAVGACLVGALLTFALVSALKNPNLALIGALMWVVAALGIQFNVIAFRTVFYLPSFTAGVALLILWKALYNPETGPINMAIMGMAEALRIPLERPQWLADTELAKPALIIMGVWTGIGGSNMLLYLAGLSNVQPELLDAADVDGASSWQRFAHVTWPQLAPTTFFISIMSIIGGMQGGFEQARVMTAGGPAGSTTTLSYYIYNKAFQDLDLGYASAISWVLFAIIFVATLVNWRFGRELEVEQ